ncbi:YbaB/EbfC family nucleoid-associated protein [Micromonospora mirobrigensis]|uniref:YbaB/EbfC DNA-binding family protein n=1 Tax=Micromonospora mirobrigensis TaxID=262898 RepID=A0A1C4WTE9_9ACTN|nr:YbaB/EbfC family nucleoid-associated protein [Micromonospora mirobrigensis]SCE99505.1 YbaB/EbfC DNA-binding family protein [Micromonospora mirobrigensis]
MWADEAALDAAARRLDDWEAGFADRANRSRQLSARVQALTGTATNADRTVEVTVDASGALVDLRLDERTRQHSAAHTAKQIMQATRAAHADLLRQVTEAATSLLGADDPTGQAIVASYRHRLDPDARR